MSTEQQSMIEDERGTSRLEAFSDGVIAVAITLLVLNITVPEPGHGESLLTGLLNLWPNYLGYLVSFLVIGTIWINHHHLFLYVKRTDHMLLILNTLFLLCVGLIPFVTALVTRYLQSSLQEEQVAALGYSGTLLLVSFSFYGLWWYASTHAELLDTRIDPAILRHLLRRASLGVPFYVVAIVLSWVSVKASLILYILITLFYARPVDRYLQKMQLRNERTLLPKTKTAAIPPGEYTEDKQREVEKE